jgi:hypothetical protein
MAAYQENIAEASSVALDASLIGPYVRDLVARYKWEGTSQELLSVLNDMFDRPRTAGSQDQPPRSKQRPKGWPDSPLKVSNQLKRIQPDLKKIGIAVTRGQTNGLGSRKWIAIERMPTGEHQPPPATMGNQRWQIPAVAPVPAGAPPPASTPLPAPVPAFGPSAPQPGAPLPAPLPFAPLPLPVLTNDATVAPVQMPAPVFFPRLPFTPQSPNDGSDTQMPAPVLFIPTPGSKS